MRLGVLPQRPWITCSVRFINFRARFFQCRSNILAIKAFRQEVWADFQARNLLANSSFEIGVSVNINTGYLVGVLAVKLSQLG